MILRNLSVFDKFMLKIGANLTKDPTEKKAMLREFDDVKKEHILFLTESVKKYIAIKEPELIPA
jgi:hypothetical protein